MDASVIWWWWCEGQEPYIYMHGTCICIYWFACSVCSVYSISISVCVCNCICDGRLRDDK